MTKKKSKLKKAIIGTLRWLFTDFWVYAGLLSFCIVVGAASLKIEMNKDLQFLLILTFAMGVVVSLKDTRFWKEYIDK